MAKKIDIIKLLLEPGIITPDKLQQAEAEAKRRGVSLEQALEKIGAISEEGIAAAKARFLGVPYLNLQEYVIDAELPKIISEDFAREYKLLPVFKIGTRLSVAMADPQDIVALDELRRISNLDVIEPVLVSESGIAWAIGVYYKQNSPLCVKTIVNSLKSENKKQEQNKPDVRLSEDAPVIKLVNLMISQAAKERASDIHIEPEEAILRVRYRVDGILHEANQLPKKLQNPVISRIKILAKMDISENRRPQDGRISMDLENKQIDIRVSTFPTVHGENVVMRLLNKSTVLLGLKELGFPKGSYQEFFKLIHRPNGIILVTGPTGSGKTTTLYAALSAISSMEKNIITIEDPVEYELALIRQTMVNIKAGITFANGLRSILRQDPDIIMVGEIRDKETADIAVQAALTGHLVFSTLHTNDAASALTRLFDMGIEPFLVASSVIGVLAQRLVRGICQKCRQPYAVQEQLLQDLGMPAKTEFYRGKGCPACANSGFFERIGIFELLVLDDEIKELVTLKRPADEIAKKAYSKGMVSLKQDGLDKVKKGMTTVEEVLRVTEAE